MRSTFVLILLGLAVSLAACGRTKIETSLPNSGELGSPRGYRISRVLSHFHSPYSYDACDKNGLPNGKPNATCLAHLKEALCANRIDFIFMTDHPDNMQLYEFNDLLLIGDKDRLVNKDGLPFLNRVFCANGTTPQLLVGFETGITALGMTRHLDPDPDVRGALYHDVSLTVRNRLRSDAEALVVIPHTESRSIDWIRDLQPDGIEIYNFHANVDPKIRSKYLGLAAFGSLPDIIGYLIDPFGQLEPDLAFMSFVEISGLYFNKWNQLIYGGLKVAAFGGSDSHENTFPQTVSDGERFDSHRRITRMLSNHYLVNDLDATEAKTAMKAGRGWVVFEGLGSPVGMDFYAVNEATTIGVGESGTFSSGTARITVKAPTLHSASPQRGSRAPTIRLRLKKVLAQGADAVVAITEGRDLIYDITESGIFRAEISIVPHHLKDLLGDFSKESENEYYWIFTNPIYLTKI